MGAEAEADPAYLTYGYPAYGYRSAYNFPAYNAYNGFYRRHFYKRSADAEAEADPAYLTYGYPATTYGYGYHHPAVSAVHSAYVALTYYSHALNNVHYLGKRSADAEADPAYLTYGYLPPPTATATTTLPSLLSTLPMLPPPTTLMPSTTSTTLARGLLRLRLTLPTLSTLDTLPTPLTLPTLVLTTMVATGPTTGSGNYSTLPNQKHARHDKKI